MRVAREGLAALLLAVAAAAAPVWAGDSDSTPPLNRLLRVGARISVKGESAEDGTIVAREIEIRRERDDDEELRGRVERLALSERAMIVVGFEIRWDESTVWQHERGRSASSEDLQEGLRIRVEGRRVPDGRFLAERVRIRDDQDYDEYRVIGRLDSIAPPTDREPGLARLTVLGRTVRVVGWTELEGPGGRALPLLQRRIGVVVDDDELQFDEHRGRRGRFAFAGEARLRGEFLDNPELDRSGVDREWVPEIFGILGVSTTLGPFAGYLQIEGQREYPIETEDPQNEGRSQVRVAEAYFQWRAAAAPWLTLAAGRQKFDEEREWFYSTKNLDAVRAFVDLYPVLLEASLSRNVFNESEFVEDQERTNLILRAVWDLRDAVAIEGYLIDRRDRTDHEDSPRYAGLRLSGEIGEELEYWIDAALQRGTRGAVDSPTGALIVRDVRAHAWDAGAILRTRRGWKPALILSHARASGEDDSIHDLTPAERSARADRTFRQSGLERNRGKYDGVVSFRYYGEFFDPELSNLDIATVGLGMRPTDALSLDLIYHRYRQDRPNRRLTDGDIDADPDGASDALGDELDLVVGYEPSRRLEIRFTAGRYRPGSAFDGRATDGVVARLQFKFRF